MDNCVEAGVAARAVAAQRVSAVSAGLETANRWGAEASAKKATKWMIDNANKVRQRLEPPGWLPLCSHTADGVPD